MTKEIIPFGVSDISSLAKHIKKEIETNPKPSHVETLNILARGAGFKNFQHLKSEASGKTIAPIENIAPSKDALSKIIKYFDANLVVKKWPNKESLRELILWFFWSRIPENVKFNEIAFSKFLNGLHSFGDAALIRRYLVEYKFVSRGSDGSDYCKISLEIPAQIVAIVNIDKADIPKPKPKLGRPKMA